MDQEAKDLLTALLGKLVSIESQVDELRREAAEIKAGIARWERDGSVIRETLETTNQQLLGRIEQLTYHYERLVGVRPIAAE